MNRIFLLFTITIYMGGRGSGGHNWPCLSNRVLRPAFPLHTYEHYDKCISTPMFVIAHDMVYTRERDILIDEGIV